MFAPSTNEDRFHEYSAPLEGAHEGRLEVRRGISECTLRALREEGATYRDGAGGLLYAAHFRGRAPEVSSHMGVVEVRYGWGGLFDWQWHVSADIALASSIPWDIELRGGVSELRADLADVRVERIEVRGGMSDARFLLGAPSRVVPIEIGGGASDIAIVRAKGTAARLRVRGGASDVKLDRQMFGAVGGELVLVTPGWKEIEPYFDIEIRGGASSISITERE